MHTTSPDYYRILQVHKEAEPEVIEAAYRRLIRKYHPDILDSNLRQSPEAIQKVQDINEAYEVLSDIHKRAQYDKMRQQNENSVLTQEISLSEISSGHSIEIEKRIYPGKCTQTKRGFLIHLARRNGSIGPFRVVGITPYEESEQPKLIDPKVHRNIIRTLFSIDLKQPAIPDNQLKTSFPSDQELLRLFDESLVLDFGNIDWAGYTCPFCKGEFTHPDGTLSTWTLCGKCSRVACAGGITRTRFGGITSCPWCGTKRQITYHVGVGVKAHKSVRGLLSSILIKSQPQKSTRPRIPERKKLPSSKRTK
jgi:curved DNA-binding protein CbpA